MRMPSKISVEVEEDRMGNVIVRPVDKRYAKAFAKVRKDNGGGGGEDAFFNDGGEAEQFKSDYLNPRQRKELEKGYPVRMKMDPWDVGHLYGYDAHTAVESTESVLRQRGYLKESGKLLGSSGSLEGIKSVIAKFYMGATVTLTPVSEKEWSVSTGRGLQSKVRVIKKGKRFAFEMKPTDQ